MPEVKVLIYGNGFDQDYLQGLLDRAEPIIQNDKVYCYVKTYKAFYEELQSKNYDLVVVSAKEDGKKGIQAACENAPALPRIWISDNLAYLIEAQRLATWMLVEPVDEPILWTALAKLLIATRRTAEG